MLLTRRVRALIGCVPFAIVPIAAGAEKCSGDPAPNSDIRGTVTLAGTGEHEFPYNSDNFGTYRTKAKGHNRGAIKAKCQWRTLVPIPHQPGKYFQTSPKKAGTWHHLSSFYKGSVTIGPVTDPKYRHQPRILETQNCPDWVMTR